MTETHRQSGLTLRRALRVYRWVFAAWLLGTWLGLTPVGTAPWALFGGLLGQWVCLALLAAAPHTAGLRGWLLGSTGLLLAARGLPFLFAPDWRSEPSAVVPWASLACLWAGVMGLQLFWVRAVRALGAAHLVDSFKVPLVLGVPAMVLGSVFGPGTLRGAGELITSWLVVPAALSFWWALNQLQRELDGGLAPTHRPHPS